MGAGFACAYPVVGGHGVLFCFLLCDNFFTSIQSITSFTNQVQHIHAVLDLFCRYEFLRGGGSDKPTSAVLPLPSVVTVCRAKIPKGALIHCYAM